MITPSPVNTAALLGLDLNGIMWCDRTLNPGLAGCAYASPACGTADRSSACYAEVTAAGIVRKGRSEKAAPGLRDVAEFYAKGLTDDGRWTGRVFVDPSRIAPAFAKLPKKAGRVRRVFVTSMSDLFHKDAPFDFLDAVFAEMTKRRHLTFQVLTKRADRMAEYAAWRESGGGKAWNVTFPYSAIWPANVWAGCTVEDQRRADERIPHLLRVPAAVRFLSVEPMLGPVAPRVYYDEAGWKSALTTYGPAKFPGQTVYPNGLARYWHGIDWIIIGSESDGPRPGARKTDPAHVLGLVDQCDAAGVPVFVKQLEIDGRLCTLPLVNGRVRAEFPETPHV